MQTRLPGAYIVKACKAIYKVQRANMFERRSTGRVCVRDCAEDYMPALENTWRGVDFLVNFTAEHSSSLKLLTVLATATELHIPSSEFVEVHCTD